jgi:hypothetical protein
MLMKKTASFEFQKCLIWSKFGRRLQIDPEAKRMEKKIYYDTVYSILCRYCPLHREWLKFATNMAIRVFELSNGGYKIRKVFA